MKVGLTYNLKSDAPSSPSPDLPDDLQEEFDSPVTIDALASVLSGLGHEVVRLGDGRALLERLLSDPPEFVFNMAEGEGVSRSREARVPAVLEMLGIPYTGSDPLTLAATLDKDCAKRLVRSAQVRVPAGAIVTAEHSFSEIRTAASTLTFPVLVKPAWEGSSKGIRNRCLVRGADELVDVCTWLRRDHRQPILVEEFIAGDELTVGILGNAPPQVLGVMRVVPREPVAHFVYSLEVKRDFRRLVEYQCPPPLPAPILRRVEEAALTAYGVLGCRDVTRVDFRLRDGVPYFLEVNPLPGINPESSDLVIMATLRGWSYSQLIEAIWQAACLRHGLSARCERARHAAPGR
jgi:D-alanine-D-alanine ligase